MQIFLNKIRFFNSAIVLVLSITYIFGADLTLSARFQFFYCPALILLVAAMTANLWQKSQSKQIFVWGKLAATMTLCLGLIGALTIVNNFAFQKVERPELVVPEILAAHDNSETPLILATSHRSHGQKGEMMSLGWHFQQHHSAIPQFVIADSSTVKEEQTTQFLIDAVSEVPRPFQLWLVNFSPKRYFRRPNFHNCIMSSRCDRHVRSFEIQIGILAPPPNRNIIGVL